MLALNVLKAENRWLRELGLRRGPVHDLRGVAGTLTNLIYLLKTAAPTELGPLFEGVLANFRSALQALDEIKPPALEATAHSLQECAVALSELEVPVTEVGPDGAVTESMHFLLAIHLADARVERLATDACVFERQPARWSDHALDGSGWTRVGTTIQRKY